MAFTKDLEGRPYIGATTRETFNLGMKRILAALLFLTLAASAWGQDFQAGLEAANRGDYATALREWRPLAEQGDTIAQYNLGIMYGNGRGVPQDYAEAVKWYRLAAEQGNTHPQFNLGVMYDNGRGVPQDYAEAMKWYRLAAEQGSANAQFNLGGMYYRGLGVPQDYAEAMKWYRLAAEQGDAEAQAKTGLRARAHEVGKGK